MRTAKVQYGPVMGTPKKQASLPLFDQQKHLPKSPTIVAFSMALGNALPGAGSASQSTDGSARPLGDALTQNAISNGANKNLSQFLQGNLIFLNDDSDDE